MESAASHSVPLPVGARPHARSRPFESSLLLAPLLPLYLTITALAQSWGPPAGDEGAFLYYAHRILSGGYADAHTLNSVGFLWHGPAIPALLAPFVAVGVPVEALRFLMAPLLFAGVLVLHRVLRLRLSARAALIGALALGIYVPIYNILGRIHKEPLAILLVTLALFGLTRYVDSGARRHVALAGLALAGLVMARLEYGWVLLALLAVCALWWVVNRGSVAARRSTAVVAVGLLGCVPWLVYTYSLTHRVFYWGNSGGSSLYWMSPTGGGETGQWYSMHTVYTQDRFARYRPFFTSLGNLRPVQHADALQSAAMANIRAHPLEYARNLAANASRLWFKMPYWPRPPLALLFAFLVFGGAAIAASAWAAATLMRHRRSVPPETLPIAAFAGIALLLHVFPSADPRMTYPVIPALVWLVAHAVAQRRAAV